MSDFEDDSFGPAQLLRAYQALAGQRSDDEVGRGLRNAIRDVLSLNPTMPVGLTGTTLDTYLAIFDLFPEREIQGSDASFRDVSRILSVRRQRF